MPLNKGHITTRQNIQMHHIPLEDATDVLRVLVASGLSSREGCGNTVRNVTGDPWAGVCEDELFDPTPYAGAYVRYFVRHPTTQLMPRKVKTAFTGTDEDRAITGIHDIAFLARERDGVRGFEVRLGGGTAIMPRIAPTLYDFVEAGNGDYLKIAEAVFRVFDRQDWLRVNRARARIKVLVDKVGIDEVRRMVDEELEGDWVDERNFDIDPILFVDDEEANAPGRRSSPTPRRTATSRSSSASAQQRAAPAPGGLQHRAGPRLPRRPDPRAAPRPRRDRARVLAAGTPARPCTRTCSCAGCATRRSTRSGSGSRELGLGAAGADEVEDVVSCPGTDSCKLGITSSMGLNAAVRERVQAMEITDPLTRRMHIKMSGCPNGCSQHHIANIGFYGASIKVGEHTIPAYVAHIAGNYEGGEVVYGTRLKVRLAAKRVPDAVERWLRLYEADRARRRGVQRLRRRASAASAFEDEVRDLSLPVEFVAGDDEHVHRLEPQRARSRSSAARASARSERQPDRHGRSSRRPSSATTRALVLLCSFQKEESVLVDELLRDRAATRRRS